MIFDTQYYPYPSQRKVVFAKNGMVATSQSLAAEAGLEILRQGGNAIDAAIATAACLTVVEPTSNGIGGDAFALVWTKNKLYGLNASGPAPKSISIDSVRKKGYQAMPDFGWIPVTVPGVPAAWAELSRKYGRISLQKTLLPAINYAETGFPVSPVVSYLWKKAYNKFSSYRNEEISKYWFESFTLDGKVPSPGDLWNFPAQAKTLQMIAETNAEVFYQGEIAEKIDSFSKKYDGYLRLEDLNSFSPEWVEPINIKYHDYHVWEIPPNGQGLVALMALNILKQMSINGKEDPITYHQQIEAMKLAFADGKKYITDYRQSSKVIKVLLSECYAAERMKMIGEIAQDPYPGKPYGSDTVYLATADNEGNMVSYIQSNYMGFGSGLVVPDTGISLQNRGANFSLDINHYNSLQPGKKTYHTIIPGFLTKENLPIGPFGVMGGFMQPQGHVQIIMNMIDFKLNPQAALDAPRWQWSEGKKIKIEQVFPRYVAEYLERKGHSIEIPMDYRGLGGFGRGQIIWKDKNNVLLGATDPRADGAVAAW
ncbi:MAG: gamma-glutamyltransferase family protein [Atribacterota bacterium]|nr:gamma-glutamyltransferase family protein [Atribacterota bacterium]